jgi:hypothetical protein
VTARIQRPSVLSAKKANALTDTQAMQRTPIQTMNSAGRVDVDMHGIMRIRRLNSPNADTAFLGSS